MTAKPDIQAVPATQLPPDAHLMQVVAGCFLTQATYVAAKLGVADLLKNNPRPVAELARETSTHERSLYRVLRALAGAGVFREVEPKVFALTPPAEFLLTDTPGSMRDAAIFMGEKWHWQVYAEMLYSVQTGRVGWEKAHGMEVFPFFQQNPEESEIFNRAMTSFSTAVIPALVEAAKENNVFEGVRTLADIAGGHGMLLAGFLHADENLKGVLFDLPHVIEGAPALLAQEGVDERVELVRGDFFAEIPVAADAYMMKFIIHDWDDERSIKILKNIRQSMPENGKVILVEMVVPAGNEPHFAKIQDLEMMVSPGGAERTEQEYRELFAAAGMRLTRVVPTKSPLSFVEAVKATS